MATKFFKKVFFSLMASPLPPPPLLMARTLGEDVLFCGSPCRLGVGHSRLGFDLSRVGVGLSIHIYLPFSSVKTKAKR